jgi:hypothetical protein
METSMINSVKTNFVKAFRGIILLVISVLSSAQSIFAQDLKNIKNSLSTIKEEQEKIAHEEMMSYIYMIVGFSVVIAIAWFTTVRARKRAKLDNEAKIKFIQQNQAKKHAAAHHHGHSHSHGLHKARR